MPPAARALWLKASFMNLRDDVACWNMKANPMSTWLASLLGFALGASLGLLVEAIFAAAHSNAAQGVLY
jgi:hypothetical protein